MSDLDDQRTVLINKLVAEYLTNKSNTDDKYYVDNLSKGRYAEDIQKIKQIVEDYKKYDKATLKKIYDTYKIEFITKITKDFMRKPTYSHSLIRSTISNKKGSNKKGGRKTRKNRK